MLQKYDCCFVADGYKIHNYLESTCVAIVLLRQFGDVLVAFSAVVCISSLILSISAAHPARYREL